MCKTARLTLSGTYVPVQVMVDLDVYALPHKIIQVDESTHTSNMFTHMFELIWLVVSGGRQVINLRLNVSLS